MKSALVLSLLYCLGGSWAKYQDQEESAETEKSVDWTLSLSLEDLSIRCTNKTTIAEKIKQAFSKCRKFSKPQTGLLSKGKKGKGKGKGKVTLRLIIFFTNYHKGQRERERKRWKKMFHC